jgi:hypothetical protein
MVEFTTTSRSIQDTGIKMLVHSGPGLGKTVLCATAPRPIILSSESGLLSLSRANIERLFGKDAPGITYDIPVINITNMQDLIGAYNWIFQNKSSGDFQTVCLDSISEIGEILLTTLKASTKDPRQAYGELIEQLSLMLRNFRDLPGLNVYMSCKQERVVDGASGAINYTMLMPGSKLAQTLPYLFDEIFALTIATAQDGKSYRVLNTQPSFSLTAKDRSGALDPLEPPNLTHIINKIRGI